MEMLIRVANCKYKEYAINGNSVTLRDAFERLIIEKLKPNLLTAPWQSFRDEELWTREVNLVFQDNADGLREIFNQYSQKEYNRIPYEKVIQLLTTDLSIKLDKFDAMYCYAMSLSTCVDLFRSAERKIFHMSYEEFLEMIGRTSDIHF